jgi:DNA end-binding protein Ku
MPASLWSGNLRLSLVIIPVKLHSAITTEEAIAFRQIHAPSGTPIRNLKGIATEQGFEEVDEDDIVKGYEHAKGQHVLIRPEEIEELKLEAKHTIDMARFVDEAEIDSRYWEKPYYLLPDGDAADDGYVVIREALKQTRKVAVGQIIMGGRAHIVGIKAHGKGLMLSILRYANEVRDAGPYFDAINAAVDEEAVALASELIERQSGRGAAKVRETVGKRMGMAAPKAAPRPSAGSKAPRARSVYGPGSPPADRITPLPTSRHSLWKEGVR